MIDAITRSNTVHRVSALLRRSHQSGPGLAARELADVDERCVARAQLIYTSSMAAVSNPRQGPGHEWTEVDWASHGREPAAWNTSYYAKSKVDTEQLVNEAAAASGGAWDVVTLNPAMICGPILFKAQNGQWIDLIGRLAAGEAVPNMDWNIIDVRDLCAAHRLAAESALDHAATHGGARYCMHGSGGPERRPGSGGSVELAGEMTAMLQRGFPSFVIGEPRTHSKGGRALVSRPAQPMINDSRKAKELLGVTLRPVEQTVCDCVESAVELGLITPTLLRRPKL